MPSTLNPYLNFKSNTREAMDFYQAVFGGDLRTATFKDYHASQSPSEDNLIMHAELHAPNGIVLMAADVPERMEFKPGNNISMSLSGDDEEQLSSYFRKLSTGGRVTEPLAKSPWGDTFGMLVDPFGIAWLVNISAKKS